MSDDQDRNPAPGTPRSDWKLAKLELQRLLLVGRIEQPEYERRLAALTTDPAPQALDPAAATTRSSRLDPKRDYRAEGELATKRAAEHMSFLRQLRDEGWAGGFALIAQSVILAGLPLRRTSEKQITREARLGDGSVLSVTFTAARKETPLPYGADVTLLYFLLDRAISAESAIFEWRYAGEYLDFLGLTDGGGNFLELRGRWKRILGLAVHLERRTDTTEHGLGLFLIEQYRLPASIAPEDPQRHLPEVPGEYAVKLNERFWRDAIKYHVPVPKDLIRETRDDLLLQRLAIFLGWRSYAAAKAITHGQDGESVIPWTAVRDLIGSDDKNPRKFRLQVRRALGRIRIFWPEINVVAEREGLLIAPPRGNVQLLSDGEAFRKQ